MAIVAESTIAHDGYTIEGFENTAPSTAVSGNVSGQSMYTRVTLSDPSGTTIGNTALWTQTYGQLVQGDNVTDAASYYLKDEAGNLFRLEEIHSGAGTYTNAETSPSTVNNVHTRSLVLQPVDDEGVNIPGSSLLTTYVPGGAYNAAAYIQNDLVDSINITLMNDITDTGNIKTTNPAGEPLFPCFTAGTAILTPDGEVRVEDLKEGDKVVGTDGVYLMLTKAFNRTMTQRDLDANPKLKPVRIMAGALGDGLPKRDLLVSRQHRMLIKSNVSKNMFDTDEVLIAAIRLTKLPGIFVDEDVKSVEYFHLLFEEHQIVYAEGAASESLFTGPEALKVVSPAVRAEIIGIFPDIKNQDYVPEPVRIIPANKLQNQFVREFAKSL
jgi:hypothetical protein